MIESEGLPHDKDATRKGNLFIHFQGNFRISIDVLSALVEFETASL